MHWGTVPEVFVPYSLDIVADKLGCIVTDSHCHVTDIPGDLHPLITLPKAFINGWESWSTVTSLVEKIEEIVSEMKVDTLAGLTANIQKSSDCDQQEAIDKAVEELELRWASPYNVISGMNFFNHFNRLSRWTQDCFDITISARQVVLFFTADEVPGEVACVINRIMDKVGNKR